MVAFKDRLKHAMNIRNISQSELCKKTGIPKSALSQYMSGAFVPKQERTYAISKALDINESWLCGHDNVEMECNNNEDEDDEILAALIRGEKRLSSEDRKKLLEIAKIIFDKYLFD